MGGVVETTKYPRLPILPEEKTRSNNSVCVCTDQRAVQVSALFLCRAKACNLCDKVLSDNENPGVDICWGMIVQYLVGSPAGVLKPVEILYISIEVEVENKPRLLRGMKVNWIGECSL